MGKKLVHYEAETTDGSPYKYKADTAAYCTVHYGADYIGYALSSVLQEVDHVFVSYVSEPSHGTRVPVKCPETFEDIERAIDRFPELSARVTYIRKEFTSEGAHRDDAVTTIATSGYRFSVCVDADEVWYPGGVTHCISRMLYNNLSTVCPSFQHFWRSFSYVCTDSMFPVRVRCARVPYKANNHLYLTLEQPVCHFGYAQSLDIVKYKMKIHGHKSEMRRDCSWFSDKFLQFPPEEDVHPTCLGIWNPVAFDKQTLPEVLHAHKYFDAEVIA